MWGLCLIALVVYLCLKAWYLSGALAACCLIIGAIGAALPHNRTKSFTDLAHPESDEGGEDIAGRDSHAESFQTARCMIPVSIVIGILAVVVGAHHGLKIYLALLLGLVAGWLVPVLAVVVIAVGKPAEPLPADSVRR